MLFTICKYSGAHSYVIACKHDGVISDRCPGQDTTHTRSDCLRRFSIRLQKCDKVSLLLTLIKMNRKRTFFDFRFVTGSTFDCWETLKTSNKSWLNMNILVDIIRRRCKNVKNPASPHHRTTWLIPSINHYLKIPNCFYRTQYLFKHALTVVMRRIDFGCLGKEKS